MPRKKTNKFKKTLALTLAHFKINIFSIKMQQYKKKEW